MKLTKKQAKELSIKKWEYIVNNDGEDDGLIDEIPELEELLNECGYCEKYWNPDHKTHGIDICSLCPLIIIPIIDENTTGCRQSNHPFDMWHLDNTKENAQAVLDLIKNS